MHTCLHEGFFGGGGICEARRKGRRTRRSVLEWEVHERGLVEDSCAEGAGRREPSHPDSPSVPEGGRESRLDLFIFLVVV